MRRGNLGKWNCTFFFGVVLFSVISPRAWATLKDCKNPTEVSINSDLKMKFCEIPAGSAAIGSKDGNIDERPVSVRDFESFQIGQFEVTQGEYRALMDDEPWKGKIHVYEAKDHPAVYVTYREAKVFARVLGLIDPTATYRLPTEAEFEYATRAGTKTSYYWGNSFDEDYAYYWDNTLDQEYGHKVSSCPNEARDSKSPGYCANPFGLMHMSGNVMEITADAYVKNYSEASSNGNEYVQGDAKSARVARGGCWVSYPSDVRSASRNFVLPDGRGSDVGFRLVRMPK